MSERRAQAACLDCDWTFLSYEALQQHYAHNPGHARRVVDAAALDPALPVPVEAEWVVFGETVETFRTLPDGVAGADLHVRYDPDRMVVAVSGAYTARIDTDRVAEELAGGLSWAVRDGFLLLSFPRWVTP
jgi:hypothetical protein